MYALMAKFLTLPETRDEFIQIVSAGAKDMAGCLSYVIAKIHFTG